MVPRQFTPGTATGHAGVGQRIKLAMGVGFASVLLVGGVSVLLAWTISTGVERGRHQSLEVEAIDQIHSLVHHFVADLHLVLQRGGRFGHKPPEAALDELRRKIAAYELLERAQEGDEARQELIRLEELKSLLGRLETASLEAIEVSERGWRPAPAQLAFLNELAHEQISVMIEELHALHRKKFQGTIDDSQQRMLLISALYVALAFGGVLLLLLGNRFLFRRLVLPITNLAHAALHVASGDLSRRVPVRSGDEVGQLSTAFNQMAERLEAHEAHRLNFEAELERQVRERTREAEETAAGQRLAGPEEQGRERCEQHRGLDTVHGALPSAFCRPSGVTRISASGRSEIPCPRRPPGPARRSQARCRCSASTCPAPRPGR